MQCNNCGGGTSEFHSTVKTSHDPDRDGVRKRLFQCDGCDKFGRVYENMDDGTVTETGIFR